MAPRSNRRTRCSRSVLMGACVLACLLVGLAAPRPATAAARTLTLERIEVSGNGRTSDEVVQRELGLRPGQVVDQDELTAAVDALRSRDLFQRIDFYTEPGSQRGALVLVLDVRENGPQVRLGTGNSDLDGWYVIPAELSLNNLLGRGEQAALQLKLGYRLAGVSAYYREGTAPGARWSWEMATSVLGSDRIYFQDGVEYAHKVTRGTVGLTVTRHLGAHWRLSAGLRGETARADSTSEVWQDSEVADAHAGDRVAFVDLPSAIAAGAGDRKRAIASADLVLDTRRGLRAGSAASGLWGRLRVQHTADDAGDFAGASVDLRAYHAAPGGVLALRLAGDVVEKPAPFYDRLYLGGLYSLRGVPSQSLSAPGGGTWLYHGSLEYRAALVGSVARPRLVGSLFLDAGQGGGPGERPHLSDITTSAGWGLRYRLASFLWLGLDVGLPLRQGPVDDVFHAHAALGWNF